MRLLHVEAVLSPDAHSTTSSLVHTFIDTAPPYAILSHRWVTDEDIQSYDAEKETTLQDVMDGKVSQKIIECCGVAHREGYQWVWIDTCCIDKSGAELSEAINSMFAWYGRSDVCYAYLSDVRSEEHDRFTDSKWFKRGWTLPELLAPQEVVFFDEDWNYIGTKGGLADKISEVTRIPHDALLDPSKCTQYSVAQRMSWAADRETLKEEDRAYSLMGLFEVYMPTIYGEGINAFSRLQQEIMKQSNDQSIFAWRGVPNKPTHLGLLAPSPSYFRDSYSIVQQRSGIQAQPYFSVTNYGVLLRAPLQKVEGKVWRAALACQSDVGAPICISLKHEGGDRYSKESDSLWDAATVTNPNVLFEVQEVHIRHTSHLPDILPSLEARRNVSCTFRVSYATLQGLDLEIDGRAPERKWTKDMDGGWRLTVDGFRESCCGVVIFRQRRSRQGFGVILGADRVPPESDSRVVWVGLIVPADDLKMVYGNEAAEAIQAAYLRSNASKSFGQPVSKSFGKGKLTVAATRDAVEGMYIVAISRR